jgi:hypothetical protein
LDTFVVYYTLGFPLPAQMDNAIDIPNPLAPEGATQRLEQALSIALPDDYRNFLAKCNGGLFTHCVFSIARYGKSSVVFLGLETGKPHNDLEHYWQQYRARIPSSAIPIGFDPGGNLVLMVTSGDLSGSIWFWDHEFESRTLDSEHCVFLASTFGAFFDNLEYEDNEPW